MNESMNFYRGIVGFTAKKQNDPSRKTITARANTTQTRATAIPEPPNYSPPSDINPSPKFNKLSAKLCEQQRPTLLEYKNKSDSQSSIVVEKWRIARRALYIYINQSSDCAVRIRFVKSSRLDGVRGCSPRVNELATSSAG